MSKDEPEGLDVVEKAKDSFKLPTGKDDFEECKKLLIKSQHNIYEDPDKHYCEIDIPDKVKLGEDLVIKLSSKVSNVHYILGDGYEWKRVERFDPKSDYQMQMRPTVDKKEKNYDKTKITIPIGKMETISKKEYQMWLTGYYYVMVRAYGNEWHEDTVVKRMVEVTQ
jgi:hypothetical protein